MSEMTKIVVIVNLGFLLGFYLYYLHSKVFVLDVLMALSLVNVSYIIFKWSYV